METTPNIATTIKGFRYDIRIQDSEAYSVRNMAAVRVYAWNWLTSPSRPMTDKEHRVCRKMAKRVWKELHCGRFRRFWHESDSGRLWI